MPELTLSCGFGLIGDDLEAKKNILLTIRDGTIQDIQVDISTKKGILQYPDYLLVPGFINAHVHIGDSFAKDQGLDCSIQELVEPPNGLKHRLLNEVSDEILMSGIKNSLQEMIASGTTTFVDFRESGKKGIKILGKVLKDTPLNAIVCGRPYPRLDSIPKIIENCDGIGLSSSNIYSENDLNYIRDACKARKKLILTHSSETKEERARALSNFQTSDIKRALNMLEADILFHITWADDGDIQLIAEKERSVVICPRSNLHLGVGYPPLNLLRKYDILTCLGTDNVMINNLNLFREMEFLFKITREKFGIKMLSCHELLKMITINPAKALKLDKMIGSIKVGKRANFFLIDLNSPNMLPLNSFYKALVLRANPSNIEAVFIGGKQVYARKEK